MFPASIGAFYAKTTPDVVHIPRVWKRDEESQPKESTDDTAPRPGLRRAAETTKKADPTEELAREIFGV